MTAALRAQPLAALLLTLALLGPGCARPSPQSQANAAERAACQRHADEVYNMRHPDAVYKADNYATSRMDAPFAGQGLGGVMTHGLSGQYQRDQLVNDCLQGGNGTVGAAPEAPTPEESGPAQP